MPPHLAEDPARSHHSVTAARTQMLARYVEPGLVHLKKSLANLAKRNLAQLTALITTRLKRMQYGPSLLEGVLASTGPDLTPFHNPAIKGV